MAEILRIYRYPNKGVVEMSWSPMSVGDIGQIFDVGYSKRMVVSVRGNFGVGGSVQIVGSDSSDNRPVQNWSVLNDQRGYPLLFTTPGIRRVHESPSRISVFINNGTSNTALTIGMLSVFTVKPQG